MEKHRSCIKNTKTKRCNKSTAKNETSAGCIYFRKTRRCRTRKVVKNVITDYYTYKIRKSAKDYLHRLVFKRSADEMRDISREKEFGLALEKYDDDKKMRDYLMEEILELANNYAREREETDIISVKGVKWVIKNDEELTTVLRK